MRSTTARALVALAAVAILAIGFVVLGGDDSGSEQAVTTPTTTEVADAGGGGGKQGQDKPKQQPEPEQVPTITIKDGQPEGGVAELTFRKGDEIRFEVGSDTADEVHLHGYDVIKDVEAGGKVSFDVPADIEGVFEAELEGTATQIVQITVNP